MHERNGLIDSDCFMTRRDQVAALAMQGLLSDYSERDPIEIALFAVTFADALLVELDKGESDEMPKEYLGENSRDMAENWLEENDKGIAEYGVNSIHIYSLAGLLDEAKAEQRQMCADTVFVCNTDAGKTPLERRRILEQACLNAGGGWR